jgi:hypothetical protein
MYNRDKIMKVLHEIHEESLTIEPYVIIAQPRRNKKETAAQNFNGYQGLHVDLLGHSHGFVDIDGEKVDVARNYLFDRVLETKAKYMFFIGEDTVVPYDAFDILHKTAEANPNSIVAGVYYMKCSNAMIMNRVNDHIIIPNVDPGQVFESWQTGMDCMLIPVEILRRLRDEDPEIPFCCIANNIGDIPFIGEDNFFVHRIRKMGVKLLVNTDVQCLHMDLASGKFTAHPDVDLSKYYTNIPVTTRLTLKDKDYIDKRWADRIPEGTGNWLPAEGIPDLLDKDAVLVGVELGTDEGLSSQYLLQSMPNLYLSGIDPYKPYTDWNGRVFDDMDQRFEKTIERTKIYSSRFILKTKTSDDAVGDYVDEELDFVFIDGLHTYEQVTKDITNYYPKLKTGGLICGHDYAKVAGVRKAVDEQAAKYGKEVLTTKQDVWYWYK